MNEDKPLINPKKRNLSTEIEEYILLSRLALDMRSTWNHAADEIWRQLDAELWERTQNPWVVLQSVSQDKLINTLANPEFRKIVDNLVQTRQEVVEQPAWFQKAHPKSPLSCVAYFCMEYMLSEALPIYSGGLGNVAGDQLKAANDLGVPVIGIGLLYQKGYFRQVIDHNGKQHALYPYNDPGLLPITPLRQENGQWLRLEVVLPGYSVWLRTWEVQVGGVQLYLLDSNDAANYPIHRGITSELYGGNAELRLQQEMLLGIGGFRLLSELGIKPEVCHLNEGHAAFAVLERARSFMQETGLSFEAALAVTRVGNVFTTHTAVAAGFDCYSPDLIKQYLTRYAVQGLGIKLEDLMALGRQNPDDQHEPFNMAYLAIRGSGAVNAVSQLHSKVSRHLFEKLFPRWPIEELPVGHVTNGVHMPTWDSAEADSLWTEFCGKDRWLGTCDTLEQSITRPSDARLWQFRSEARKSLVVYARKRLSQQFAVGGAPSQDIDAAKRLFDENTLTLGFARRFACYKRPNLLLHNPERLLRILTNPQRPVQLIIAGKAHPVDVKGQALIQQWQQFISQPEARQHVIFLSDYDMQLTQKLVQGVDVWLNTPRRPWEACGTSGMKVLVNGGINLSELDGWWAEAYSPELGWALGDGLERGDDIAWDAVEAEALYDLLENEVIPEFYTRDNQGISTAWVARMRESMSQLTPRFSASRAVIDYTEQYYLPAVKAYLERAKDKGKIGEKIVKFQHELNQKWGLLRLGEIKIVSSEQVYCVDVQVYLDGLEPDCVKVELYANGINDAAAEIIEMQRMSPLVGATNGYNYHARVPAVRPVMDYTVRIIPFYTGVSIPLEAPHILWQR
jgi:glycogen phosphorylase